MHIILLIWPVDPYLYLVVNFGSFIDSGNVDVVKGFAEWILDLCQIRLSFFLILIQGLV